MRFIDNIDSIAKSVEHDACGLKAEIVTIGAVLQKQIAWRGWGFMLAAIQLDERVELLRARQVWEHTIPEIRANSSDGQQVAVRGAERYRPVDFGKISESFSDMILATLLDCQH